MQVWIILTVISVIPVLLSILFWMWLFPRRLPKQLPGSDDDEGNNSGLPLIPISPYNPKVEWLTDRFEKSTESKATKLH